VEIEEKDSVEVAQPGILPEGVDVKNPYFDITPPELIAGIITEDGMVKPADLLHYFVKLTAELR
jgi:methylthioribose-1-phosphate isomerase